MSGELPCGVLRIEPGSLATITSTLNHLPNPMIANLDCQLDRSQGHLGNKLLGVSEMVFPERLSGAGKTHFEYEGYHGFI